ncbi:MAG: flagellar basal-body MS-ring/collar protein FliF [Nitrospiraceae bacterium]|jgi:flagellar M-ring protein FliF|nr:flagellar basal-body MS-ring/collar protein FliF [Nitrospiraceae bacterium]
MDILRKIFETVSLWFGRLSLGQKIVAGVLGVLLAGVMIFLGVAGKNVDQAVLYSRLSPVDSFEIQQKLDRMGIPYAVSTKGGVIRVPKSQVYTLRMELADEGLPRHHGAGFDIFDHPSLTTTDFVQHVQYLQALQSELDRTIEEMSPIALARVSIVLPRRSVFLRHQAGAHASVLVRLKPGRTLDQGQVNGIVHLVANAVEGLTPEHVTIVDNTGTILNRKRQGLVPGELTKAQLAYQSMVEHRLRRRVQTMLDQVLGEGQSVVRVNATLNFRRVEETSEQFDPKGRALAEREKLREKSSGSRIVPVGIPGVLSNIPGPSGKVASPPLGPKNGTESRYSKKKDIEHYDVSHTMSHIVEPTGTVAKISVSVLVNGKTRTVAGKQGETTVYEPRTPEEIASFTRIVQNAIGYDASRGDTVVVDSVPFVRPESEGAKNQEARMAERLKPFLPLLEIFLGGLLVLVFSLFILKPILQSMVTKAVPLPAQGPGVMPIPVRESEQEVVRSSKEDVAQMTQEDPSQAAQVLRLWLKEK